MRQLRIYLGHPPCRAYSIHLTLNGVTLKDCIGFKLGNIEVGAESTLDEITALALCIANGPLTLLRFATDERGGVLVEDDEIVIRPDSYMPGEYTFIKSPPPSQDKQ